MRKLFLKKHALYVFAMILLWLIQLLINYYEMFNPYNVKIDDNGKITYN